MTHSCGMSLCVLVHFEPAGALNWEWRQETPCRLIYWPGRVHYDGKKTSSYFSEFTKTVKKMSLNMHLTHCSLVGGGCSFLCHFTVKFHVKFFLFFFFLRDLDSLLTLLICEWSHQIFASSTQKDLRDLNGKATSRACSFVLPISTNIILSRLNVNYYNQYLLPDCYPIK